MSSIALIDGDVLAHIACKGRWEFLQKVRGINKGDPRWTFKPPPEGFEFTEEEEQEYLEDSWGNFLVHVDTMLERLYLDKTDYLMAVKGSSNYRDQVYSEYKAHRATENPNLFVPMIRDMAVSHGMAIHAENREADDYLRIWSIEARNNGLTSIICSVDKDLKCIPGKYYNVKTNELETITPEFALRFYYQQLLQGDATDNVPGIPGIGPKKAEGLLADFETEEEYQDIVCMAYEAAYGDEWESYLLLNGKMIYIQESLDSYFSIENWAYVKEQREQRKMQASEKTSGASSPNPTALTPKLAAPSLKVEPSAKNLVPPKTSVSTS